MMLKSLLKRFVLSAIFLATSSFSLMANIPLSEAEFRDLARDLAPKITLFAEIWAQDPNAKLYGGTSRDFLYWILGQLNRGISPQSLRKLKVIDIRSIVGIESDIDVISKVNFDLDPKFYGIRKIDRIAPQRFDPSTEIGRAELDQGFIPIEKIQIGMRGINKSREFGDGLKEILTGNLSIHFSDEKTFWNSYYAKQNLNHPVLLAVRYLRLRALDWYNRHGDGMPDRKRLLDFDPKIKEKIRKIFLDAIGDPRFEALLAKSKANRWLNQSILKAFRSYTNPTAAYYLFSDLGFKSLQAVYPDIESINQFLFIQHRNGKKIEETFRRFKTKPSDIYVSASKAIPDLKLFHGTRLEESFRGILFQNIIPSERGSAGSGLYAVDSAHQDFAGKWAGSVDRVVVFKISNTAKVIDISKGPGKKLFKEWSRITGKKEDAFAEAFGADILIYPYINIGTSYAFIVKNSAVLVERQGLTRQLMSVGEAIEIAKKVKTRKSFRKLIEIIMFNYFSSQEEALILEHLKFYPDIFADAESILKSADVTDEEIYFFMSYGLALKRIDLLHNLIKRKKLSRRTFDLLFQNDADEKYFYKQGIHEALIEAEIELPWFVKTIIGRPPSFIPLNVQNQWLERIAVKGGADNEIVFHFSPRGVEQRFGDMLLLERKVFHTASNVEAMQKILDPIVARGRADVRLTEYFHHPFDSDYHPEPHLDIYWHKLPHFKMWINKMLERAHSPKILEWVFKPYLYRSLSPENLQQINILLSSTEISHEVRLLVYRKLFSHRDRFWKHSDAYLWFLHYKLYFLRMGIGDLSGNHKGMIPSITYKRLSSTRNHPHLDENQVAKLLFYILIAEESLNLKAPTRSGLEAFKEIKALARKNYEARRYLQYLTFNDKSFYNIEAIEFLEDLAGKDARAKEGIFHYFTHQFQSAKILSPSQVQRGVSDKLMKSLLQKKKKELAGIRRQCLKELKRIHHDDI